MMLNDGLIIEYMDLSNIHLAVGSFIVQVKKLKRNVLVLCIQTDFLYKK